MFAAVPPPGLVPFATSFYLVPVTFLQTLRIG